MTDTLIALISIFMGLIGANLFALVFRKYSMGLIGNTIIGIFGSIFFIKAFGRLGFGPKQIMQSGDVNFLLFSINMAVSILGGITGLFLVKILKTKIDQKSSEKGRK